jgi:anti-sigma B factor antagonist
MPDTFRVEATDIGPSLEVRLVGDVDLAAFDTIDTLLATAQSNGTRDVLVDLRPVTFIDSSGIRVLVRAAMRADDLGGRFRLIPGSTQVQRVFQITALENRLRFVDPSGFDGSQGQLTRSLPGS